MDATQFRLAQLEIAVNILFAVIANDRALIGKLVEAQQNTTEGLEITAVTMTNVMTLVGRIMERNNENV